jgi:hypothetical protein
VTWNADEPAGTSLAIHARTGHTPSPDGSWTPFTLVPASGSSLGLAGRYLQYRADLATSDPDRTPALEEIAFACEFVATVGDDVPSLTLAMPASPNPLSGHTVFEYVIGSDVAGAGTVRVSLGIYDLQGRLVRTLRDGSQSSGRYRVAWDGTGDGGRRLSPGLYVSRFQAGTVVRHGKLTLLR